MAIEDLTYIDGLIPEWPLQTDKGKEGDDHIRVIKQALKNTFPNINGALTATLENINAVTSQLVHSPADPESGAPEYFNVSRADFLALIHMNVLPGSPAMPQAAMTYESVINLIYPVGGSPLITFNPANPVDYLGIGTWVQRQAGVLYSAGVSDDGRGRQQNLPVGNVGGWWQINHEMIVPRDYTFDGATTTDAPHAHTIPSAPSTGAGTPALVEGPHVSGHYMTTETNGNHNHNTRSAGRIGLGTDNHRAPGLALYIWERTA